MERVWLALLLPLFLLSGCFLEGLTGADNGDLDFAWEPAGHGQWLPQPEVEAVGGAGELTVTARLSAPDPCQRLTGRLSRSGARLTLRVRVLGRGDPCAAALGTFRYTAVVRGLAPGTYQLRVVHEYPNTGWSSGPCSRRRSPFTDRPGRPPMLRPRASMVCAETASL